MKAGAREAEREIVKRLEKVSVAFFQYQPSGKDAKKAIKTTTEITESTKSQQIQLSSA